MNLFLIMIYNTGINDARNQKYEILPGIGKISADRHKKQSV